MDSLLLCFYQRVAVTKSYFVDYIYLTEKNMLMAEKLKALLWMEYIFPRLEALRCLNLKYVAKSLNCWQYRLFQMFYLSFHNVLLSHWFPSLIHPIFQLSEPLTYILLHVQMIYHCLCILNLALSSLPSTCFTQQV